VVDDSGRLVGIVSSQHIAEAFLKGNLDAAVEGYMDQSVLTVSPEEDILEIMRRFLRAIALNSPFGDVSTLEDETSVEEARKVFEELVEERQAVRPEASRGSTLHDAQRAR